MDNTQKEASAAAWEALAIKTDEWASKLAFLPKGDMPESIENLHGKADLYRNTAASIRMEIKTGVAHCPCTNPPHIVKVA
jgi:hypothetical protein